MITHGSSGVGGTAGFAVRGLLSPYIGSEAAGVAAIAIGAVIGGLFSGTVDRGVYMDWNALLNVPVGFGYQ